MKPPHSPRSRPTSPVFWWIVGGAALGFAALPAAIAWASLHPPRRLHRKNPRTALGLDYERVRLRTDDNMWLSAWLVPHPSPRGVAVICHGHSGNRETMLPYLRFLHDGGYAALLFDFRAHGWSGGGRTTFGLTESSDLHAAIDFAVAESAWSDLPLVLVAESMGGAVALTVAANDSKVRAVVSDSAFARFDLAIHGRLSSVFGPRLADSLTPRTRAVGERLLRAPAESIAPIDAIRRLAPRPVLLIHGEADRTVPVASARLLHAAHPTSELWTIPGAAHVRSVYLAEDYADRVLDFLNRATT